MRPSASASGTVSMPASGCNRAAISATVSSTVIIGPPNAKQSSESCAIPHPFIASFAAVTRATGPVPI